MILKIIQIILIVYAIVVGAIIVRDYKKKEYLKKRRYCITSQEQL